MKAYLTRGAAAALTIAALAACEGDGTGSQSGTFYGAALAVGDGQARTYVVLEDGQATELGVALSEDALEGLPAPTGQAQHDGGHHAAAEGELLLPIPAQASGLPFQLVEVNWNPAGHPPEGVYTLPHFDFHFYTTSKAERDAIDPADPQFQQKADHLPAEAFRPSGYVSPEGMAVPRMGRHWVDPTSPELNGGTFTQTFMFGSWDGEMTFYEPMITRAYLAGKPSFTGTVAAAQSYAPAGRYPTQYRIYWNEATKEHRVSLAGFQQKG